MTSLCARRLLREYEEQVAAQRDGAQEELSTDVLSAVERNIPAATRHFAEFAAAVSRAPQQVVFLTMRQQQVRCYSEVADDDQLERRVVIEQHSGCCR